MTAYDVDLAELRSAVAELACCQRDLVALAGELDEAQSLLRADWSGQSSDAQSASYTSWRTGCAEMVTALAALRGIVAAADERYSSAAAANVALWQQVSA